MASIILMLCLGIPVAQAAESVMLPPRSSAVSILSANYTGTVNDRVAQVEAVLRVSTAKPDQTVPLFGEDVAIQQFTVKGGDAKLVTEGNAVSIRVKNKGE